jgi:hypothetical protein
MIDAAALRSRLAAGHELGPQDRAALLHARPLLQSFRSSNRPGARMVRATA